MKCHACGHEAPSQLMIPEFDRLSLRPNGQVICRDGEACFERRHPGVREKFLTLTGTPA